MKWPGGQDVVALRAENDPLRRALAGRAVIDQASFSEAAGALVAAWADESLPVRMQCALRRFHAENQGGDSRPPGVSSR